MSETATVAESTAGSSADVSTNDSNIDHMMGDGGGTQPESIEGIEAPSEQELMGIESEPEEKETSEDESSAESKEAASSESKEEESEEKVSDQESELEVEAASEESAEDTTPPKGFVPLAAIKEARGENRYLKEEMQRMAGQIEALSQQQVKPQESKVEEDSGFKELSDAEFKSLLEDEPMDAVAYMMQLRAHDRDKMVQEREQDALDARNADAQVSVEASYNRMEEALPGLFDEYSDVGDSITAFTDEIGFPEQLHVLTDPNTVILADGMDEPVVLGEMAADMLDMFVGLKTKFSERGSKKETVRAELEKSIRAEVQKELLTKFKTDGESAFKSVSSLQGTERKEPDVGFDGKVLDDAAFAKLSTADQERYLSGA